MGSLIFGFKISTFWQISVFFGNGPDSSWDLSKFDKFF